MTRWLAAGKVHSARNIIGGWRECLCFEGRSVKRFRSFSPKGVPRGGQWGTPAADRKQRQAHDHRAGSRRRLLTLQMALKKEWIGCKPHQIMLPAPGCRSPSARCAKLGQHLAWRVRRPINWNCHYHLSSWCGCPPSSHSSAAATARAAQAPCRVACSPPRQWRR